MNESLNGTFGNALDEALMAPGVYRLPSGEALGKLTTSVDRTYLAEKFEQSVLTLNKITPHQRKALNACIGSTGDVHVAAAAGTGKTFIAMHFMMDKLREFSRDTDRTKRILFIARKRPLVLHVVH